LGADALNICLAVGPQNANAIRHVCLRDNMEYLEHRLDQYVGDEIESDHVNVYALEWMAVNTDWRKHCTEQNRKDFAIVQYKEGDDDEEGEESDGDEDSTDYRRRIHALVLFNNPLVAIEFGLVGPLKHLVEEVGIDINSHQWNAYTEIDREHLLSFALLEKNSSGLRYLLSREDLNVNGAAAAFRDGTTFRNGNTAKSIIHYAFDEGMVSLASFEAITSHSSYDVNFQMVYDGELVNPLHYACHSIGANLNNELTTDLDKKEEKFMVLLNKVKAHAPMRPLHVLRPAIAVAELHRNENPRMRRIYWAMMDEFMSWMMTPNSNFYDDES
jgi:hypothetical protein